MLKEVVASYDIWRRHTIKHTGKRGVLRSACNYADADAHKVPRGEDNEEPNT